MSFTDLKRHTFDEHDALSSWCGHRNRGVLCCASCNHQFCVGDGFRWIYDLGTEPRFGNFFVCDKCDCDDIQSQYKEACSLIYEELKGKDEGHWPTATVMNLIRKLKQYE